MPCARDLQYVSLMSTPFSGSTLLSMLLCSQPRSIGFGDTYFGLESDPRNDCTCGVPFLECQPRINVQQAIHAGGISDFSWENAAPVPTPHRISLNKRKYWPLYLSASLTPTRLLPATVRRRMFSRFYRENDLMLAGLAGSGQYDYYFDGCKSPVRLELLRTEIPDLKVIHMVRHPGAFVYRDYRRGWKNPEKRLGQWTRYHGRVRSFMKYVGESNYIAVTYEDIVQEPGVFLRKVRDFLEMDEIYDDPPFLLRRSEIHIQGNKMRKTADRVLNLANKWRGQLPAHLEAASLKTLKEMPWADSLYDD